jgi:hypothetical protein
MEYKIIQPLSMLRIIESIGCIINPFKDISKLQISDYHLSVKHISYMRLALMLATELIDIISLIPKYNISLKLLKILM